MSEELKNQPAVDTGAAEEVSEQVAVRMDKMHKLEEKGILPFGHAYKVTHHNKEVHDKVKELEEKGAEVRVAGRLTAIRGHGKTAFMDLLDKSGKIQLYVRKDELGEDNYSVVKLLDIGDIVGVEGEVFTTHMGEPSIRVKKLEFLSKALKPLPEKWHGLKDKEIRYRQRYVDLIVNPEVRDTFVKRTEIIKSIRNILDNEGYLEVETPVLNTISGGATARPFVTHHNALDIDLYLRIATELNLKRLIVGGLERVYEIGRIFRNEGMDIKHNPEFTSIELYEAYGDYQTMMDITEKLVSETAQRVLGTMKITYQGKEIDLTPPWPRMTMVEAVKKFSGYDFTGVRDVETARKLAADANVEIQPTFGPGKILEAFFDEFVEKNLIQPTFIMGHPKEISPLAKSSLADPEVTDRFEGFINGSEICNGFTELNDPIDQKERFEKQVEERNNGDDEAGMMDEDFINALMHGLPPTGGLGIGIDRLVMLLTNSASIRDVLLFPTMKPLGLEKKDESVAAAPAAPAETVDAPQTVALEKIDFSNVTIEPLFKDFVDFDQFAGCDFRVVKVKDCFEVPKNKKLLQFTLDDGTGTDRTILSGIKAYYQAEDLIGRTLVAIVNLPPRKMMGIESCGMLLSAEHNEGEERKLNLLMLDPHIPAGAKLC